MKNNYHGYSFTCSQQSDDTVHIFDEGDLDDKIPSID